MHYEKDYSAQNDKEKFFNAINDCKEYFGNEKFEKIIVAMRDGEQISFQSFRMQMAFVAGVEGYPVNAMYEYAYGVELD